MERMTARWAGRTESLRWATDAALVAAGYYRHCRVWRRKGVVTMRGKGTCKRIGEAIARDTARRFFDGVEDLDAALGRYKDVADAALDELVKAISPDPYAQEAHARRVEQVASDLAAGCDDPAVKILARSAAVLRLDVNLADTLFYRLLGGGQLKSPEAREVGKWQARSARRLDSTIRTLAYVKRCEISEIAETLDGLRLRVVG